MKNARMIKTSRGNNTHRDILIILGALLLIGVFTIERRTGNQVSLNLFESNISLSYNYYTNQLPNLNESIYQYYIPDSYVVCDTDSDCVLSRYLPRRCCFEDCPGFFSYHFTANQFEEKWRGDNCNSHNYLGVGEYKWSCFSCEYDAGLNENAFPSCINHTCASRTGYGITIIRGKV